MKSACPWDPSLGPNRWELIERAMYTNQMLLATAETVPRLISGIPDKASRHPPLSHTDIRVMARTNVVVERTERAL